MKTRFFLCYNVADTGERCREMSNGYREVQDLRKEDEHKGASLAKKEEQKEGYCEEVLRNYDCSMLRHQYGRRLRAASIFGG